MGGVIWVKCKVGCCKQNLEPSQWELRSWLLVELHRKVSVLTANWKEVNRHEFLDSICAYHLLNHSFCSSSVFLVGYVRESQGQASCERLLLSVPLDPALLVLVFGDNVLEELIDRPADSSWGHLVYNPGLNAFEVSGKATKPVDSPEGMAEARDLSIAPSDWIERQRLLRVQQRLANVQWRGGGGSDGACQRARHHVRGEVVLSLGVQQLLQIFIGHEVQCLEWDVHGELCGVAAIKRQRPLLLPHAAHTVQNATVWRVIHLHPLLHHWTRESDRKQKEDRKGNIRQVQEVRSWLKYSRSIKAETSGHERIKRASCLLTYSQEVYGEWEQVSMQGLSLPPALINLEPQECRNRHWDLAHRGISANATVSTSHSC